MFGLYQALNLLGLPDIKYLSIYSIKRAFREKILESHPDKGGDETAFDDILFAYSYLLNVLKNVKGGRVGLTDIEAPEILKEKWDEEFKKVFELNGEEINEFMNEIFTEENNKKFNEMFEKIKNENINESENKINDGYESWLKNTDNIKNITEESDGKIKIIRDESINLDNFNQKFTESVKLGKEEPKAIILHLDKLAHLSGTVLGTELIPTDTSNYTSNLYTNPEFTDLYSAYTDDNTLTDKLVFGHVDEKIEIDNKFNEIIKSRNEEIKPLSEEEETERLNFEKEEFEKEKKRMESVRKYYNNESFGNNYICDDGEEDQRRYKRFIHTF